MSSQTIQWLKKWGFKNLVLLYVFGPVAGVVVAAYLSWQRYVFPLDIALLLGMYFFTSLGVTIGYHRMLTHDGFKTHPVIKAFFLIMGVMAMAGSPLSWAATHIKHHAHSDHDGDPHSPLEGFWHAHFGWILDNEYFRDPGTYADHLRQDPVVMFVNRTTLFWSLVSFAIPFAIGGWTGLVWGGGVRVFLTNHITWGVNSICHTFGKRAFETTDESRNNWFIGILAMGEGWHNNHHAFPNNAFHGMKWYQFDMSGIIIRFLERIGLVWEVQRVGKQTLEAHKQRGVSMHENISALKEELGRFIDDVRSEMDAMVDRLPPQKVAAVRYAHEQTIQRLSDIQLHMARRRNMKKAAIEKRRQEVAELFEIAKQRIEMTKV